MAREHEEHDIMLTSYSHLQKNRRRTERRKRKRNEWKKIFRHEHYMCVMLFTYFIWAFIHNLTRNISRAYFNSMKRESSVCGWWWVEMRSDRRRFEGRNRDCLVVRSRTSTCQQCVSFFSFKIFNRERQPAQLQCWKPLRFLL